MTTHHFGTDQNPAHYVEIDDGTSNPPPRPTAADISGGLVLNCQNATDLSDLPDVDIEARTGYFEFTTTDIPQVNVSADGGVTWIPLFSTEALAAAVGAGVGASAALTAATAAQAAVTAINSSLGEPDGIATLGGDGQVDDSQIAGLTPEVQNGDGSWNPRPVTFRPIEWLRIIPGSAGPTVGGTTTSGTGFVSGFDYLIDVAVDFGG